MSKNKMPKQTRAETKLAAKREARAKREEAKAANLHREAEREAKAKAAREAKAKERAAILKAQEHAERAKRLARLGSQERAWTVRLKFAKGIADVALVRLDAPNPKGIPEARIAKKIRAETAERTGLTRSGDLPGLTYREAERLAESLGRKLSARVSRVG